MGSSRQRESRPGDQNHPVGEAELPAARRVRRQVRDGGVLGHITLPGDPFKPHSGPVGVCRSLEGSGRGFA